MMIIFLFLVIVILETHGQHNCDWGKYGKDCSKDCPSKCIPDSRNLTHCHKETGKCSEGCVPGWFEDLCDKACSKNCLRKTCNRQNGICTFGCGGGYSGDFCNIPTGTPMTTPREHSTYTSPTTPSKTSTETTPSESKTETTPDLAAILVPVFIILLVVLAVIGIILFIYKRKRKRCDRIIDSVTAILPCWITTNTPDAANSDVEAELPLVKQGGADTDKLSLAEQDGEDNDTTEKDSDPACSFVVLEDAHLPSGPLEQKIKEVQRVFVESESFKEVKEKLQTFGHVTITGAPGAGKTSMALMLGVEYWKQGYELVLVEDVKNIHWSDYLNKDKPLCVIFDDIFKTVRSYMDLSGFKYVLYDLHMHLESRSERRYQRLHQEPREEQRRLDHQNICVIFTAETNSLERAMSKLGDQRIFKSSSDVKLTCTQEEKKALWLNYKLPYEYESDVKNVFADENKTTVGFPLACKLFLDVQMRHDNYFENPIFYISNQIRKTISSMDVKSAALILILLCDGQLNISQLETEDPCPMYQLDTKGPRLGNQQNTEGQRPGNQLNTEGQHPGNQLNAEGQLETAGDRSNSQLEAAGASSKTQLEAAGDCPKSQLEAADASPKSPLENAGDRPKSQLEAADASPKSPLENAGDRPKSQLEAADASPKSPLENAGDRPKSQLEAAGAHPKSQLEAAGAIPDLEAHLQAVATLVKTSTRQGVAEAVKGFCGTLLTEGNITSFSHSILYDVCALVLFGIAPEFILKHCSIKFLFEHVCDQTVERIPVNKHQLMIPFSEAYSGIIATRMADAVVSGALSMYIWHPIWKKTEIALKISHIITNRATLPDDAKHNILHYACVTGNKYILEQLVPSCDINKRGLNGWTPAMFAVVSGQMDCFDILVKSKADITSFDNNGYNLLHLACKHGDVSTVKHVKKVIKKREPNWYLDHFINGQTVNGWTPVMCAVAFGKQDVLDYLTKNGKKRDLRKPNKIDFKLADINRNTVLHLACLYGNTSIVKSLLPHADINTRGSNGHTPVMCAVLSERKDTFDLLLSNKADITLTDDDNNSLLHLACHADDVSIIAQIAPKFDINSRGKHGWTPLMKAAVNGKMDVFEHFLHTLKADLALKDGNNNNILHLACLGGNVSIVKLLLPKLDINSRGNNGWTPVMFAAVNGVESVFQFLVSEGADIRLRDDKNNSVLHLACFGANIFILKDLMERIDINCVGDHGRTSIMVTAMLAKPTLFEVLLSKKANITQTDDYNDNALHYACHGGNNSIVNYLMSKDNMNTRGKYGRTPVMVAAREGRKDVFFLLVKENVDLSLTDEYEDNVLHLACQGGSLTIVEYVVTHFEVNLQRKNDSTPVIRTVKPVFSVNKDAYDSNAPKEDAQPSTSSENDVNRAVSQGGKDVSVKKVIDSFDINARARDDQTPLMRSVFGGNLAVFRFLVSHGADQTLVDKGGHTLLHLAAQHGQLRMTKYLIDSCDVNTKDTHGMTPVMTSVVYGRVAVFEYLKDRGADLSLFDNAGNDVLALAHKTGCRQIIEQLEQAIKSKRLSIKKDLSFGKLFHSKKKRQSHKLTSLEVTGKE